MASIGLTLVKWRYIKLTACCIPRHTAYYCNREYSEPWLRPKTLNPSIVRPRSTRTSAEEQVNSFDAANIDGNIDETTRPNIISKLSRARANIHRNPTVTPGKAKTTQLSKIDLTFSDTKEAYRSKTIYEIFRALLVLKLCQFDTLVEKNKQVLKWSKRILGQRLFEVALRATFYGHFVAGEDEPSIKPIVKRINEYGVGAILDYSVEEDLPHSEAVAAEMKSCTSLGKEEDATADRHKQFKAYKQFADRREDVASARTYFYHNESKCDENLDTLLNCIDVAGMTSSNGFAAIKLTALGRPQLLLNLSEVLTQTRKVFMQMVNCNASSDLMEQRLTRDEFQRQLAEMGLRSRDETGEWFTWMDTNQKGSIDLLDWDRLMQPNLKLSKLFKIPRIEKGKLHPYLLTLTDEEEVQMKRMLKRIDAIAKRATEKNVRLMVDAEQTYFQPAISRLAIEMMRKFNKQKAVIFNTYQCYLKQCSNQLGIDLELSKREDFWFGVKLVRGAYMAQERKRAKEIGYPDPINVDYDATSQCYHHCLDRLLNEISMTEKINVMVASHNEDTVRTAVNRMEELNINPNDQLVYFGQLFGMCDQVSFTLGQAGYSVYKYVPYGPVNDVIPYLSRRAFENRGMLKGVAKERDLLWKELKRRIWNREILLTSEGS